VAVEQPATAARTAVVAATSHRLVGEIMTAFPGSTGETDAGPRRLMIMGKIGGL
jgi:hypothetical protein